MAVIQYKNTIGLAVILPDSDRPQLVRVRYDLHDDGLRHVSLCSGRNMAQLNRYGVKKMTPEQIDDLLTFDDVQTFKNLAALFGVTV